MNNKFFLWVVSALLLLVGCTNDEIVNEQQTPEEGKITLTVSMPGESPETRVGLARQEGMKNIIVTWRVGDQAKFFFEQNASIVEGALVTLTAEKITMGGKQAAFAVDIPDGINGQNPYTVYMVHGAESKLTVDGKILINVTPLELMPIADLHDVPVAGSVEVAGGASVGDIPLQHLGTLQCVTIKNSSAESVQFSLYLDLANWEVDDFWFYWIGFDNDYNPNSVPYYNLKSGQVENIVEQVTMPDEVLITIVPNDTKLLAQWIMPVPDMHTPEIYIFRSMPGSQYSYSSHNTKPERSTAMQTGKVYHLYALWDGTDLFFTDNTFTPLTPPQPPLPSPLEGDLMHADGGDDYIGVVYSKNDGNVYYNSTQDCSNWLGETLLGTGTEARIAIDRIDGSYKPHVVFTTSDNKIAYTKYDGTAWSDLVYIESNFSGACSLPDIDVDVNGYAHITYTDTKGASDIYQDIMYAENSTNSFVKTVIFNGEYDYEYKNGNYYDNGSRIAVDEAGNYYIMAWHRYYEPGYNGYNIKIKTSTSSGNTSPTTNTDHHAIYDMVGYSESAYALYKDNGVIRTGSISLNGTITSELYEALETQTIIPHSLSPRSEVAGLSGTNLFVKYHDGGSGYETVYHYITVKNNTRVVVVNKDNDYDYAYVFYTDDTDSKIKVKQIETRPAT
ncbi:MAG: hypothetical protein GX125_08995 [Bacteroidales bacterium]|jgi:hypothetical protein|nr:hypothetical protein [Bacteroidales bacterium]